MVLSLRRADALRVEPRSQVINDSLFYRYINSGDTPKLIMVPSLEILRISGKEPLFLMSNNEYGICKEITILNLKKYFSQS